MNSNATAGVSRALPRIWVCCVAIAASGSSGKLDETAVRSFSGTDGSQFAACREEIAARIEAIALFDIAGALHFALGRGLRGGECCVHGRGTGQRRRELLADGGADTLELRNRRVLHADIGHRLYGRVVRIGSVNRRQRQLGEGCDLQICQILLVPDPAAEWPFGPFAL